MKSHMLFIVNPSSGTVKIKDYFFEINRIFSEAGYVVHTVLTRYVRETLRELLSEEGAHYDMIVVSGGDGTFNSLISTTLSMGVHTPIGYIPSGSTNDFAKGIGLRGTPVDIAKQLMTGTPRTLDIGTFNDKYFSYVASFGAFTDTSYNTPQELKNMLGHLAYILEGIKDISAIKPCRLRITCNDTVLEGEYILGAFANATSIGGMIHLDDRLVDFNDGKFEAMLIRMPKTIFDLTDIIFSLNTQNYTSNNISFFQGSEFIIEPLDPSMPWTLDGEFAEGQDKIIIRNLKSAISINV